MAIVAGEPGLDPRYLHVARPDDGADPRCIGKLLFSPGYAKVTRSVSPRFVACVADMLVKTTWGSRYTVATCTRETEFRIAPIHYNDVTRRSGRQYGGAETRMVVEKAKGSDEWNCFSDHDEADFSASYEHVLKMGAYQNVQCLAVMVATDEQVARAASLVEPVQLDPPTATPGFIDETAWYGVMANPAEPTPFPEPYPANVFAVAARVTQPFDASLARVSGAPGASSFSFSDGEGGTVSGSVMALKYNMNGVAAAFVASLKRLSESEGEEVSGKFYPDYRAFAALPGSALDHYLYVSAADYQAMKQEAEAATRDMRQAGLKTSSQVSYYESALNTYDSNATGRVLLNGNDGARLWSVITPDVAMSGGVTAMALYPPKPPEEDDGHEETACEKAGGTSWKHMPQENMLGEGVSVKAGADAAYVSFSVPVKLLRAPTEAELEADPDLKFVVAEETSVGFQMRIDRQLKSSAVRALVADEYDSMLRELEREEQLMSDHGKSIGTKLRELVAEKMIYPSGLVNAEDDKYVPLPDSADDLKDPPFTEQRSTGRTPIDYHTAKDLRELLGMAEPEKPGYGPDIEGNATWFSELPVGSAHRFCGYAYQTDDKGVPTESGLTITKAWSWDRHGDNHYLQQVQELKNGGGS